MMTRPRLDPRVAGSRCHHQGGGESGDHDPPRDGGGGDGESHQCDNQQQDGGHQWPPADISIVTREMCHNSRSLPRAPPPPAC